MNKDMGGWSPGAGPGVASGSGLESYESCASYVSALSASPSWTRGSGSESSTPSDDGSVAATETLSGSEAEEEPVEVEVGLWSDATVPHPRFPWLRRKKRGAKRAVFYPGTTRALPTSRGVVAWNNVFAVRKRSGIPPLWVRLLLAFLLTIMVIGPALAYALIGAFAGTIRDRYNLTRTELAALFAVYAAPNMVVVLFGGVVSDRLGITTAMLVCVGFYMIGNLLPLLDSYWALFAGRFLYGMGFETLSGVVQSSMVAMWFERDPIVSYATVLSLTMALHRVSGFLALFVLPRFSFLAALWFVAGACAFSAVISLIVAVFNHAFSEYLSERRNATPAIIPPPHTHTDAAAADLIADVVLSPKRSIYTELVDLVVCLRRFTPLMWLITLLNFLIYTSILSFLAFGVDFLTRTFKGYTEQSAAAAMSYIYVAALCVLPIAGQVIDRLGRRVSILILGALFPIAGYAYLLFGTTLPEIGCLLLGVGFGVVPAAIWSSPPLIVSSVYEGTAFGLMSAVYNIGIFLFPILATIVFSSSTGSTWAVFIMSMATVAFGVVLRFVDIAYRSPLERTIVAHHHINPALIECETVIVEPDGTVIDAPEHDDGDNPVPAPPAALPAALPAITPIHDPLLVP